MALTSASTLAEVLAAYENNLDYDLAESTVKAQAFIQAARILLVRRAQEVEADSTGRIRFDMERIQAQLDKAETWFKQQSPGSDRRVSSGFTRLVAN